MEVKVNTEGFKWNPLWTVILGSIWMEPMNRICSSILSTNRLILSELLEDLSSSFSIKLLKEFQGYM